MVGTRRNVAAIAVLALALLLPCGSALAAPPTEPPGKSGDAPGHQTDKHDDKSSPEPTPPGHVEPEAPAPEGVATVVTPPAEPEKQKPAAESPRFENAAGKPKRNVPAAAEAAPEATVSAQGNSGRHKLTICHKGHAITVDVHAARAHVDGHGDTYATAGARGRAACPQSLAPGPGPTPTPTPPNETPSGPGAVRPDLSAAAVATGRSTTHAVAPVDPAVGPTGVKGASETAHEQSGAVLAAAGAAGGDLPFTGAPLGLVVLLGIGLICGGALLCRSSSLGWATNRSSSR